MAYPKGTNVSVQIGTFRDWRNGIPGNPITGYQYQTLHSLSGGMPISLAHRRKRGKWMSGGPWLMWKEEAIHRPSQSVKTYRISNNIAYEGRYVSSFVPYAAIPTSWNTQAGLDAEYNALKARGAEAWNRMRPDLPDFSFATSVYELKDTLPVLKKALNRVIGRTARAINTSHRSRIRRGGELYLAAQFGYIPLVRDIRKFVVAQRGAQRTLDRLIRNNGRPQRRRRTLSESETSSFTQTSSTNDSNMFPAHVTQCYPGHGTTETIRRTTTKRTWCAGRFRYLLPPGPRNVAWNRKMLRRIMGGRITPRELYQIIPWSWLGDYFTDLGQFISATSPGVADRLIADYAYLMCTIEHKVELERMQSVRTSRDGTQTARLAAGTTTYRTIKMRVHASPFGFGLSQNNLTPYQVSILGALGLSRI